MYSKNSIKKCKTETRCFQNKKYELHFLSNVKFNFLDGRFFKYFKWTWKIMDGLGRIHSYDSKRLAFKILPERISHREMKKVLD